MVRQGRRHGPSITYKITPCWVTLLQPARRAAELNQPSSLRPPCSRPSILTCFCDSPLEDFRANCTSRCPCAVWKSWGTKRAAAGAEIMRESIMKFPPRTNLCRLQPLTLRLLYRQIRSFPGYSSHPFRNIFGLVYKIVGYN